jgi:hypothetical protein
MWTLDSNGDILVSGYSEGGGPHHHRVRHKPYFGGGLDAYTILFNSSGARQWATYLGGNSIDFAWARDRTPPDLFYIAGNTSSSERCGHPWRA